ncbi:hypothetical protein [Encephalitozoon cuniculi GB-M1]|uniref:CTLH domain-containing protein n=2 Tax=Encephalitozoon cuniculi TaxID=6035 RepID=Q8SVP7_ENCCU|nr:uncharacterized protein ECU04_1620 [Encephalitozoon cuniculi GB-M1]AGE95304.1 hypothetical protein ECU04_1620 [Encephalitozoon cuniculi]KMV66367.1 hypothetical protein M970_041610 [Encephalitozoon cuniculi EcunIII-L]UYI27550.1 hypothetical protein J0A71_06g14230 [Encephalitozoon cuniculi]CAD25351.1 hypothetical protein [Encephalitozoon cuniculi GB-M1]
MVDHDNPDHSREDLESLAKRIIADHMRFVCADKALMLWNKRCQGHCNESADDTELYSSITTRKRIMSLIEKENTDEAFRICEDLKLFDLGIENETLVKEALSKLVFVDLLRAGRHVEAIRFARTFMNDENENDRLFTLIGYKDVDDPRFHEIADSIRRENVMEVLNKHLFRKEVGRELSLLSLALSHYNSILKYQRK